MHKFNPANIQLLPNDSLARDLQHFAASIDAHNLSFGIRLQQLTNKTSVAFAEDQRRTRRSNFAQKFGAASLKRSSGQNAFHPEIMRREPVKSLPADFPSLNGKRTPRTPIRAFSP